MNNIDLKDIVKEREPQQIIKWAIENTKNPIVTTNFRPYEVAILHACTQVKKDIPVIWCDTGYNTPQTYAHAEYVIKELALNITTYVPKQTVAHRSVTIGIPSIEDDTHKLFTEQVKLEPFRRAMKEMQPDAWFTNLRKGQTAYRDTLDVVTISDDGVLKVSPFFHWTDQQLDQYLETHHLKNEFKYFDPTKVLENRECGLHAAN